MVLLVQVVCPVLIERGETVFRPFEPKKKQSSHSHHPIQHQMGFRDILDSKGTVAVRHGRRNRERTVGDHYPNPNPTAIPYNHIHQRQSRQVLANIALASCGVRYVASDGGMLLCRGEVAVRCFSLLAVMVRYVSLSCLRE